MNRVDAKRKHPVSPWAAVTITSAVVAVIALAVMTAVLIAAGTDGADGFVPPPFDSEAVTGAPEVPDHLGYSRLYREGMDFSVWVCGNVTVEEREAWVYLTNPAENTVWMKLRVLDGEGNILGETGLIRPGEYVERVTLVEDVPDDGAIRMKIMAYEPHTYYSAGAVTLRAQVRTE